MKISNIHSQSLPYICIIALLLGGLLAGFYFGIKFKTNKPVITQTPMIPVGMPSIANSHDSTSDKISPTINPKNQLLSIPSDWKTYSKNFQGLHFTFSYPPNLSISDGDPDSGEIELLLDLNKVLLSIGRFAAVGIPEYTGGGRREWFIKGAKSVSPGSTISQNNYNFIPLEFASGNSFYLVKENQAVSGEMPWPLQKDMDFYFGIFNGKSVMILDVKSLPQENVYRIMQSLKVY